jgi:hypothetical protein
MNSASQPTGISSAGMPGAALMQTASTWPARATHQSSGGSEAPARKRRASGAEAVPGPERRAGSMNTASTPAKGTSRTSATTAVTCPARP